MYTTHHQCVGDDDNHTQCFDALHQRGGKEKLCCISENVENEREREK